MGPRQGGGAGEGRHWQQVGPQRVFALAFTLTLALTLTLTLTLAFTGPTTRFLLLGGRGATESADKSKQGEWQETVHG
jgi:hypothetical protein